MTKTNLLVMVIFFLIAVFVIAPMLTQCTEAESEEDSSSEYSEESDDFDLDLKKSKITKSARSAGGSRSFRSGK